MSLNENQTAKTIKTRRSVRKFEKTEIPQDQLEFLIKMASYAPSPRNRQPWKFIVLTHRKKIDAICELIAEKIDNSEATINPDYKEDFRQYRKNSLFFKEAGALILVLLKPMSMSSREHYWGVPGFIAHQAGARGDIISVGCACQNLLLAAESIGLSTCLMSYPLIAQDEINTLLDIRPPWQAMVFIALGKSSAGDQNVPPRRALEKIAEFHRTEK